MWTIHTEDVFAQLLKMSVYKWLWRLLQDNNVSFNPTWSIILRFVEQMEE